MKHKLQISVSKNAQTRGIASVRSVTVREKFLRMLFGDKRRVTVLIPGDSVDEVAICEKGGTENEQGQTASRRG